MRNYFLLFAFFTLISFSFASSHPKLVIELFRHGARGPLYHKNDSYWRGKEGQLTDIGKAQHLVLGASLMERYPHLKESLKDPSKLYLQSTQYKRTLESLKFHLWGMYNGGNITFGDLNIYDSSFYTKYQNHKAFKKFNPFNLTEIMNFTPAPIKINPLAQDYELLTLELPFCQNTESLLGMEHLDSFDFFMNMVSNHVKYYLDKSLNGQQIYDVYDLVYANLFEGKDLIHNITTDSRVWNHIKHGAEYFVTYMRYGSELKRKLYGMPLFKKILGLLEKSFEGVLPYDLVLLSAHDITVFNLLTALNVIHPQCFIDKMKGDTGNQHCHFPNYASQILVELWERDGVPKIKILYEKEVINLCKTEDGECTLRQLQDLFEQDFANVRLEDVFSHCEAEQVCRLNDEDELSDTLPLCEFNDNHW